MEQTDGYKLIRQVGTGITGPVWMADGPAGRVAMRGFASPATQGSEEWAADRTHFLQAAKQSLAFRHPRVVPVLDIVDDPTDAWVASEFVEDETLESLLKRERLSAPQAAQIMRSIGPILDQAHRSGLVHGDLKPSNIFIGAKNTVRLGDFAISPRARRSPRTEVPPGWVHPYLTPEHLIAPGMIGPRTDVYAMAAIGYLMFTGKAPFSSGGDVKAAILRGQLDSMPNGAVAGSVEPALRKAMSRDPGQRFADCGELVAAVEAATRSMPAAAAPAAAAGSSPTMIYVGIGSLVIALIVAAFLLLHGPRKSERVAEVAPRGGASGATGLAAAPAPTGADGKAAKKTRTRGDKSDGQGTELAKNDVKPGPFEDRPRPPRDPQPEPPPNRQNARGSVSVPVTTNPTSNGIGSRGPIADPKPRQEIVFIPSGDEPKGYSLKVYSRKDDPKHLIGKGISFKYFDPDLGEMGMGDLMAKVILNGPPPAKGHRLSIVWVVDGQILDGHLVNPNTITAFGSEPIRGTYQIILRVDNDPVADYTFRITP